MKCNFPNERNTSNYNNKFLFFDILYGSFLRTFFDTSLEV